MVAKAAKLIRARADEFAPPVTLELGKLITEARGEVMGLRNHERQ